MAENPVDRFPRRRLPVGQRLALRIEYDGTPFCGWQAQPHLPHIQTVQSTVEAALAGIADHAVTIHCAGRTDTGVHATAQWIHFDSPTERSLKDWVLGGNARLPDEVRIADACAVDAAFHARHSAEARCYDYLIANTDTASALLSKRALWVRQALDAERMHRALQPLLGERDFSAFRAAACQSTSPMRHVELASVIRNGRYLCVRLVANAFLHHMVRNIVGSVLEVGRGLQSTDWLAELLETRDRTLAAATAKPHGLYLTGVRYPVECGLSPAVPLPYFPGL